MKIVVMGTGPFAVPTCRALREAGMQIVLCVTRPLPQRRPKKAPPRPVYQWATNENIEIYQPQSINAPEAVARLRKLAPDLLFVCDYGQILSADTLGTARLGGINLHGSLLPRHRGAAPVQWTLLRGDTVAGVSVIHMTPKLDAGPILAVAEAPVLADETAAELEPRLAELGPGATLDAIAQLATWDGKSAIGQPQVPELATRAPRLQKQQGQLDFRLPAEYLVRLIRGLQPWPGTYADLELPSGKTMRVMIRRARAIDAIQGSLNPGDSAVCGACQTVDSHALGRDWKAPRDKLLAVQTGQGLLLAAELQPAGKRVMSAAELARGYQVSGARFLLPDPPCGQLC